MTRSEQGPAATQALPNGHREHAAAVHTEEVLAAALSGDYQVHRGASLLYRIEIDSSGKASHDGQDAPRRGQYAFQTDILVTRAKTPLVVVELKAGFFSSHDVITYSWKAQRHKQVYPYLRYGFAVVGLEALGRRFMTHNEAFDFAAAIPDHGRIETDLVPIVLRQIRSAERIIDLTRHGRIKLRRYEQNVEIDG
ncbi:MULTISPECIES: hypothetical protein [Bradyrhizobium]|nr:MULTISPECIES: hypothetical protein [Bradyrhizobium]MCP1929818.1 hypothetical protein [Bradyrhizobium elkanii]